MKITKKCTALLLAVLMLFVLSSSIAAADADLSGHTYKSYQIFSGTQAAGDERLAMIEWGTGINSTDFLDALKNSEVFGDTFDDCNEASEVAEKISGWVDRSDNAKAFARLAYIFRTAVSGGTTGLDSGYYLVVDETEFDTNAVNTVHNLALLQLTKNGDFTITSKVDVPVVQKKVKDINDSEDTTHDGWHDSADYDIHDKVPFQLTATLASIDEYDTYKVIFHDTLSNGLTYDENSAVIKIDGRTVTNSFAIDQDPDSNSKELTFSCSDVKTLGAVNNSVITVEYTATLNDDAVIGSAGNPNYVQLEYSNNPNESSDDYTDNTGKTPTDKVIVFTYKIIVNKTNEDNEPLVGATFELLKQAKDGSFASLGSVDGTALTQFEWTGIDDGIYKLHEVTAPKGYEKIEDMLFTVTAEHDLDSDNPALTSLTGRDSITEVDIFTGSLTAGTLSFTVVNEAGIPMPETGGRGTTIIYILGAVMLLGASVILIARKRMNYNQ